MFMAFCSAQKTFILERPQQPKAYGPLYPGPLHNLAECECLPFIVELTKQGAGTRDSFKFVVRLLSKSTRFAVCEHDAILAPATGL